MRNPTAVDHIPTQILIRFALLDEISLQSWVSLLRDSHYSQTALSAVGRNSVQLRTGSTVAGMMHIETAIKATWIKI